MPQNNSRGKLKMVIEYDSSWDLEKNENGNLPRNENSFDKIFSEWEKRSWTSWLQENLKLPFPVERVEDEDDAYFTDAAKTEPFRLGQEMIVVDIEMEDDHYGVILKVTQGRRRGNVPLCDVEVVSKENVNYWPVREYVVWFANR